MAHLFNTFKLKEVTLRNRIGVSPMCQYSATEGFVNEWHIVNAGSRAVGGAGLIIVEATAVEARGRISPFDLGLWDDAHLEGHARLTQFVKQQGAVAGIQLAHAGRKASCARPWEEAGRSLRVEEGAWQTVAPSEIAFGGNMTHVPHALSLDEIKHIQLSFQKAAKRAFDAGYEWLEIHAAHGYLLHSFYSPLCNKRTDQYGGTFDNRIRMLLETIHSVKAVWPSYLPLTVRLSTTDWMEHGWNIQDSVLLARELKAIGVDLIDCSSGFNGPDTSTYPFGTSWQVPLSETIKREVDIPTAAVGMIVHPLQADEIIRNQRADLVLIGREMLRDPHWAYHASLVLRKPQAHTLPIQYSAVWAK